MVAVKSLSDFDSMRGGVTLKARVRHIDDRLVWFGFFRLVDHIETFQISEVQGKVDLQTYRALSSTPPPDRKAGRPLTGQRAVEGPGVYERPEVFIPVFPGPQNFDDLFETKLRDSTSRTSMTMARIDAPFRTVEPDRVRAILAATELSECCAIQYQSLTSDNETERTISPHTLVRASSRWHVRAFDFGRSRFVDFSLSRVKASLRQCRKAPVPGDIDSDWNTVIEVDIVPNPRLSPSQREMVAYEFGMQDGHKVRAIRKALLFYLLDELRLLREGTLPSAPPIESSLWIANSEEVIEYLERMHF